MSANASTVRACRNMQEHDTEPCTFPCPSPSEASTWPAPSSTLRSPGWDEPYVAPGPETERIDVESLEVRLVLRGKQPSASLMALVEDEELYELVAESAAQEVAA